LDVLEKMLSIQKQFQNRYNFQRPVHEWCSAMASECMELWSTSGGKWWKDSVGPRAEQREELADILHFFLGLCLEMRVTPDELCAEYEKKMSKNIERQENKTESNKVSVLDVGKGVRFNELLGSMRQLRAVKNADYGSLFLESYNDKEIGNYNIICDIERKSKRLRHILLKHGGNVNVAKETVYDTLLDLAIISLNVIIALEERADK